MFLHEVNEPLIQEIASYVKGDPSRSWGMPEWLIMKSGSYDETLRAIRIMDKYGIKYLCPFNWGGNDDYDFKHSDGARALQDFLGSTGE